MDNNILYLLLFSLIVNLLMYLVAYRFQTDKLTDISYATTFAILVAVGFGLSPRRPIDAALLVLVLLWAVRLGSYLFYRIHHIGRDKRFDDIRNNPRSFLGFWIMQGLTCGIVSLPFLLAFQAEAATLSPVFWVGSVVAIIGLVIETVADLQKFWFKQAHPAQFMQSGLWRRLRHPNYTGELLFWWGLFAAVAPFVHVWIAVIGPLWITMILVKFSGIPILERQWDSHYGNDAQFQAYKAQSWRLLPFVY